MINKLRKPYKYFAFFITAVVVVAIIGVIIYYLVKNSTDSDSIPRGAVVTNGHTCADIGASILRKGGNAVDAAIAALFCEGVSMPQSMGLGGGFLMTIYNRQNRSAITLNAREAAPDLASENMFDGNPALSTKGGLAVAVPGELLGYWEAYHRFGGNVEWKELVQPTIDLCNNGILVTEYLGRLYKSVEETLRNDTPLRETYIDPATNSTYVQGQYVKRPRLAKTLEKIAKQGANVLYNGDLTEGFVNDVKQKGGIITVEDMKNYRIEWQEPVTISLPSNQVLYTSPLPGSGVILGFIMNILNGFIDYTQPDSVENWQRIIESFKFGYGRRTELGDSKFVDNINELITNLTSASYAAGIRQEISDTGTHQDPEYYGAKTVQTENHGTAHVSVLAPNGDAVSVTSTINLYFGAGFMSDSTGIILNDEMDDFSSPNINNSFGMPPSVANYIKPGKRPLSSMCPSIIVAEDGEVELVIGAAGGTKITTSVAQIAIKNLWFNIPIQEAVSSRRMHHQLFPMVVSLEQPFKEDTDFLEALRTIGHVYEISESTGFSAVTSISRKGGTLRTATDQRRTGEVAIIY
ncbi:hypothetical protein Zmor_022353 [Zophobas morio]|uniref:Gamma-glutamyltranspeptidase 1 n=1 Tax=Zophobas morio TaxID=2755281 RepID=A0AA38HYJ5_9CUCU|nr:hypothetical protein Zmor_022353 [Zophobas morio]